MLPLLHRLCRQIDDLDANRLQVLLMGAMAFVLFAVIGGFTALSGNSKVGLEWLIVGGGLMALAAIVSGVMTLVLKVKRKSYSATFDKTFEMLAGR